MRSVAHVQFSAHSNVVSIGLHSYQTNLLLCILVEGLFTVNFSISQWVNVTYIKTTPISLTTWASSLATPLQKCLYFFHNNGKVVWVSKDHQGYFLVRWKQSGTMYRKGVNQSLSNHMPEPKVPRAPEAPPNCLSWFAFNYSASCCHLCPTVVKENLIHHGPVLIAQMPIIGIFGSEPWSAWALWSVCVYVATNWASCNALFSARPSIKAIN